MMRAVSLVIAVSYAAFAQPAAKLPEFEVAEVQVSKSNNPNQGKGGILPSGRVDVPNMTIKNFMVFAYNVQENMITGGPGWIDSDRFDIVAKAPPNTPPDTIRLMLRSLLLERFKLAIHREDKPVPVYEMVVAKGGPKLKAGTGSQSCRWNNPGSGRIQRECHGMTMQELANEIPLWGPARVDRPVVNSTEIAGTWDFQLEWNLPARGDAAKEDTPDAGGATIFDAMSQIGLKLEQRKRPMPVIVIDHVERVPQ